MRQPWPISGHCLGIHLEMPRKITNILSTWRVTWYSGRGGRLQYMNSELCRYTNAEFIWKYWNNNTTTTTTTTTTTHKKSIINRPRVRESKAERIDHRTELGDTLSWLQLRHPRCVSNIRCRQGSQTTMYFNLHISRTTYFGLYRGHHQVRVHLHKSYWTLS